jgi:hypothetical protein
MSGGAGCQNRAQLVQTASMDRTSTSAPTTALPGASAYAWSFYWRFS